MNLTDLLHFLLEATNQLRVLHWSTFSYSEHVALGDLYDALNDGTDKIAEALMGAQGKRLQLKGTLELVDYAEGMPASYVAGLGKALESIAGLPTDILNTRDDLLGAVHKASYLLTLSGEKPEAAEEGTGTALPAPESEQESMPEEASQMATKAAEPATPLE